MMKEDEVLSKLKLFKEALISKNDKIKSLEEENAKLKSDLTEKTEHPFSEEIESTIKEIEELA